MATLATDFVVMPGGFGTMEEMLEMVTWTQLGVHRKSVGVLNVCGFWDHLDALFKAATQEGFIRDHCLDIVVVHADVDGLLDAVLAHTPPPGLSKEWKASEL